MLLTKKQRQFLENQAKHMSKADLDKHIREANDHNQPLYNKMVRDLLKA